MVCTICLCFYNFKNCFKRKKVNNKHDISNDFIFPPIKQEKRFQKTSTSNSSENRSFSRIVPMSCRSNSSNFTFCPQESVVEGQGEGYEFKIHEMLYNLGIQKQKGKKRLLSRLVFLKKILKTCLATLFASILF